MGKKTSAAYKDFDSEDGNQLISTAIIHNLPEFDIFSADGAYPCKYCPGITVKSKGGSSNLTKHINKAAHQINKKDVIAKEQGRPPIFPSLPSVQVEPDQENDDEDIVEIVENIVPGSSSQSGVPQKIDDLFSSQKEYAEGTKKCKDLTNALAFMLAKDRLPFNFVEHEGFQAFMRLAVPGYKIPGRTKMTSILDSKYLVLKDITIKKFEGATWISLTGDLWTDPLNNKSYLGLTAHFLDNDKIVTIYLTLLTAECEHTFEEIGEEMIAVCAAWHIDLNKIVTITTDGGTNICKAVATYFPSVCHLKCFAHTLDLVAKIPEKVPEGKEAIGEVKAITKFVKKSGPANRLLRKLQGKKKLKLKQSVPTRWNSVFLQIERFFQIKDIVDEILTKVKKSPANVSDESMCFLKDMFPILEHFSKASKYSCGQQYVTASALMPMVKNLRALINKENPETEEGKACKKMILDNYDERFGDFETRTFLTVATMLDPRFKARYFKADGGRNLLEAERVLKEEMHSMLTTIVAEKEPGAGETGIWLMHGTFVGDSCAPTREEIVDLEYQVYMSSKMLNIDENPLEFWKDNSTKYPLMYKVAQKYFCAMATSVPSEGYFSLASLILCKRRNRLTSDNFSQMLFMSTVPILDWDLNPKALPKK